MTDTFFPMPPHLVFLPATDPGETTFGVIPECIPTHPELRLDAVFFPTMVWYNRQVRAAAIEQIKRLATGRVVLVGFSKSGLGAWNLTRELADRVAATIIFDAPVARDQLPPWGTAPFYGDDEAWQEDLPIRHIAAHREAVPASHRLILVTGANFHDEMVTFSAALNEQGVAHDLVALPDRRHHWDSGWLGVALARL